MRCPDEEIFARYAEGKLNEEEISEFLEHLCKCSECSVLYAMTYGRLDKSINTYPEEECMASLTKHPAAAPAAPKTYRKVYRLVAMAAMIALIFGFTGIHNVFYRQNVYTLEAPVVAGNDIDAPQEPQQPEPQGRRRQPVPQVQAQQQPIDLGISSLRMHEQTLTQQPTPLPEPAPAPLASPVPDEIDPRQIAHFNAQRLLNSEERADWQQAYYAYVRLAESYSGDYLAAYWAGEAARKLGDNDNAGMWYDRALAINPDYQPAIDARAGIN